VDIDIFAYLSDCYAIMRRLFVRFLLLHFYGFYALLPDEA